MGSETIRFLENQHFVKVKNSQSSILSFKKIKPQNSWEINIILWFTREVFPFYSPVIHKEESIRIFPTKIALTWLARSEVCLQEW